MQPIYRVAPLLLVAALAQATLSPTVALGIRPDLVVILVLVWAASQTPQQSIVCGALGGAFLDVASFTPVGLHFIALALVALPLSLLRHLPIEGALLRSLIAVAVGTAAYDGMVLWWLQTAGRPVLWQATLSSIIAPSVFVNTLLAVPFYAAFHRFGISGPPSPVAEQTFH